MSTRHFVGKKNLKSCHEFSFQKDFVRYSYVWWGVIGEWVSHHGSGFEGTKGRFAERLYRQRGKWSRPFSHIGMVSIVLVGMVLAPVMANGYSALFPDKVETWQFSESTVLLASTGEEISTIISDKDRDKVWEHVVGDGDTLSLISKKYGVSVDTIRWANNLDFRDTIKPGQKLSILPVSGVKHTVKKGETVYTIAKKYNAEPQAIVDYPFNSFANDETFALSLGQDLIVPGGEMPEPAVSITRPSNVAQTPSGGAVTGSGQFAWPTNGRITQGYSWYHQAFDIANRDAPNILAADSGRVTVAGWPDNSGYGNRVLIDHGNGFITLYGHLSAIYVQPGQYVNRGEPIGKMGTTGRSTGIHLHFEIRKAGARLNPMQFLK